MAKKREKSDRNIRKSDQKVTERVPKTKKSDRTPFAGILLRHPESGSKRVRLAVPRGQKLPIFANIGNFCYSLALISY